MIKDIKTSQALSMAIEWLNRNRKQIEKTQSGFFDFPDYWGMPESISNRLMTDDVDYIQEETSDW